ncbi:MAG TPA: FecR family protein [Candidatus Binatia bacterium]
MTVFGKAVVRPVAAATAFLFLFSMMLTAPAPARGQPYQDYQDPGYDDEIDQVAARVSYVQGPVSYGRGDDPDNWDPAVVNVPFTLGDRLYSSADGRAELQLPGGNFVRLGRGSYLTALTLTEDTKQLYLGNGAVTVNLRRLDPDEVFEIDTPNSAVTLEGPGRYRVEVDEDGNSRIVVRRGTATVAANGRQVAVERAEMRVYGMDSPQYETAGLRPADAFDRWVDEREGRFDRSYRTAYQHADEGIVGLDELEPYGRWENIPDYGYAWTPTQVAVGWQPFTLGHWFWQDPWGWTWISEEPWGWAPCHYGRWTSYRSRWYWVPERRRAVVRYAPAVVEFVRVREHVGWFPLHPRDRFVPWWGRRGGRVEEVNFVNRTSIVIVNEQTFVSGRRVTTSIVRDTTIIRESTTVRVVDRRLPIPRRESIRVVSERRDAPRPPANILSRPVVVRAAPAPPPPRFEQKLSLIQQREGRALTTREEIQLGAKDFKANRRVQIRPAAEGRGDFVSKTPNAPAPQPITPVKGRKLATSNDPIVTDLPPRQQRQQERQVQQQQQKDQDLQRKDLEKQKQEQKQQERTLQKDDRQQQKEQDQQRKDLERKQQDQDRLQKQQERDRQKDEKQLQQQQQKDQDQQRKDLDRKQQDQDRLQKQQDQDRQKQLQEQKRRDDQQQKDQDQQRKDLERKQQDQERLQKQQDQDRQKQLQEQKRRDDQQQKDLERQKQDQERERQKLLQEQQRKDQQQQRDLEKQKQDQARERQKQLQDEQQKQRQLQQDQQRQPQQEQKQQDQPRKLPPQKKEPPPPDDRQRGNTQNGLPPPGPPPR